MSSLISIIVPIYGVEKYIHKCVDSIINQTYDNLEIILVDDGSPDRCPQICDEYAEKDSRIKVIHKENGGQGSARNMALDICQGEYVSFVDGDDSIDHTMIENMYNEVAAEDAQLVICGIKSDNGLKIQKAIFYPIRKVMMKKTLIKTYISTPYISTGVCGKLYLRELFNNIRFPHVRAREDAYILHEVLGKADKTVLLPECYYIQLIRHNSTEQRKFNLDKLVILDCIERLQSFVKENYPDLYCYVEYKYAKELILLMEDIVGDFVFFYYRDLYSDLQHDLGNEIYSLAERGAKGKQFEKIRFIYKHRRIFFISALGKGIAIMIKRIAKLCLIKLKFKNV